MLLDAGEKSFATILPGFGFPVSDLFLLTAMNAMNANFPAPPLQFLVQPPFLGPKKQPKPSNVPGSPSPLRVMG